MSDWRSDYSHCDVCAGTVKLFCPWCFREISSHSHEDDFICKQHSFVNPLTEDDLRSMKRALQAIVAPSEDGRDE